MAEVHRNDNVAQPTSPIRDKDRFYSYFQQEVIEIQEQIDRLSTLGGVGGERQDAIDHCLASISRLSSEVSYSNDVVPAYDQRRYAQAIRALTEKLTETRSQILPRAKFSFRPPKPSNAVSISAAAELAAASRSRDAPSNAPTTLPTPSPGSSAITTPSERNDTLSSLPTFPKMKDYNAEMSAAPGKRGIRKPSFSQASSITLSSHTGLHIILPTTASRATSSGLVTSLKSCIVDMSVPTSSGTPFAGLHLKNIKKSLVIAGQVAGAAHVTGVEDSILVVQSRQVRLHECRGLDVYLAVGSRPIIEDCEGVRFAPAPRMHSAMPENQENQWDQVDDFKWLKTEPSPNWSILPEADRLSDDVWENVVPGEPGVSVGEILAKIGL